MPLPNFQNDDKSLDIIKVLHSENGEHAHYILNGNVIKSDLEAKYMNVNGGEYKFLLSSETFKGFPELQLFSHETLDWEPIKLSYYTVIGGLKNSLAPNLKKPNSVDQAILSKNDTSLEAAFVEYPYILAFGKVKLMAKNSMTSNPKKIMLEHIQRSYESTNFYISQNISYVRDTLEDYSMLEISNGNAYKDYYNSRFCFHILDDAKCRPKVALSILHQRWLEEVDTYIMDIYNQKPDPPMDLKLLRLKIDTLCKINGVLLATLMLRRLIFFCKVLFWSNIPEIENL